MIITIVLLSLLLLLSLALNVFCIWVNRQVVAKLFYVSDNIGDTMGIIQEYQEHLESLYEMEMFYGDDTLQGLIEHTKFIIDEIKGFEEIYSLTVDEENVDDDETLQA
tara:strand:- start:37 stop:360 length:324 start_codon:yes stop_codon:yes gene_type:complete